MTVREVLRGAVAEVARVLHVEGDRVRAAELVADVLRHQRGAHDVGRDVPVTKTKTDYSRSRWQVDAHAFWRSSGVTT